MNDLYDWYDKPVALAPASHFISLDDVVNKYPYCKGAIASEIETNGVWFIDDFGRPKKLKTELVPKALDALKYIEEGKKRRSFFSHLFSSDADVMLRIESYFVGWPLSKVPDFESIVAAGTIIDESVSHKDPVGIAVFKANDGGENIEDNAKFCPSIDCTLISEEKPLATADRAHVSNNLAILNQAAAKFWANADRDDRTTHPRKNDVVAWLIERGFSDITAKCGATIIRPQWAPTGRKVEE